MANRFDTLIAGEWAAGARGEWFDVRNPADASDVVGAFPALAEDDAARAVEAARDALPGWRSTSVIERGDILRRAAGLVRERRESIARDVTREMGKLIAEARSEVTKVADFLEYYASFGRRPVGELLPDARPGAEARAVREPRGVALAITPWNDPILTPARKLCPALIAGNTVVLKPAPESPLSALHLARAMDDAGLPPGALSVVTGPGDEVSRRLVTSDGFDAVTFTGSTAVGLELQRQLAGRNIPLQTEMGGKNAAVVLADANPDLVIEALVTGAFAQAGQRCTATSRVLVEADRYDAVVDRLAERTRVIRVGPGLDESSEMGPVVAERRLEEILGYLERGCRAGAEIAVGGERLDDDRRGNGWFLAPTVVAGVDERSELWHDELFGPVVGLMPVDSIERAIQLVNESRYGLSASIFTRDLAAAHRFVDGVDVGCVAVNLPTAGWDVHMPFGGFRDSGSAFKEQGTAALEFYTRIKTVAMKVRGI